MGLFQPYQRAEKTAKTASEAAAPEVVEASVGVKKKIATPTRREAEQARRERLHPVLTKKEVRARDRDARMAAANEQRKAVDSQPGRQLARDFVDSRRTMCQFAMPIILLTLVVQVIGGAFTAEIAYISMFATWAIILAMVLEIVFLEVKFAKLHRERLPREPLRGLRFYLFNRAINPRRMRLPQPRVQIGEQI